MAIDATIQPQYKYLIIQSLNATTVLPTQTSLKTATIVKVYSGCMEFAEGNAILYVATGIEKSFTNNGEKYICISQSDILLTYPAALP